ncbi:MAG: hypothetical protein H7839_07055 [Magnetococcus sp. YQC-5]
MPVIDPVSMEDCVDFVNKNKEDIRDGTYDVKIQASWLTALPSEMVRFLLEYCISTKKVVARVLKGTGPGVTILEQLGRDDNQEVRLCVASNPHAPVATLETLAEDYFEEVRLAVAKNPGLPNELLNQLSQDASTYIRCAVVQNPKTPLKIMNRLASDRSKVVSDAVVHLAQGTKASATLSLLAKCSQADVRGAVCNNNAVSLEIVDVLCRDENSLVQEAAKKRLLAFAESPQTSPELLRQFAIHNSLEILMALGRNPSTPEDILERLARHHDERVRQAVAQNSSLSDSLMMTLAGDEVTLVRVAMAQRTDISMAVCEHLAQNESSTVLQVLGTNPIERERRKMNHLCVDCGKKLLGMGKTLGAQCFVCIGKKIMQR